MKVNSEARKDPSNTKTLRNRFMRDVRKRLRKVRGDMVRTIDDEGVRDTEALKRRISDTIDRVFMESRADVEANAFHANEEDHWSRRYISAAIESGARDGRNRLKSRGMIDEEQAELPPAEVLIGTDRFQRRLADASRRAVRELRNMTRQMKLRLIRELEAGMDEGIGATEMKRRLRNAMPAAQARAETIAQTEVIRSHHKANLDMLREASVEEVEVMAEFQTAGDQYVCPQCESLEGTKYKIDEAENLIPVHPNCRCSVMPVPPNISKSRQRREAAERRRRIREAKEAATGG